MEIIPVNDPSGSKLFLQVPVHLYKNDPNWIRPLDKDVENVFNEKKNKAFRAGNVQRWILKDNEGNLAGRIAAFTNKRYKNKGDKVPVGGMGFFECINDQDAADLLLNNAKHWLLQNNMEAMDGPINFGERDRWWGLVTDGFHEPLYCMNYNFPYYKDLLEHYGFKEFYSQICLSMKPKEPFNKKIWERHALIAQDRNFRAEHIRKNELDKYAGYFTEVYNKAWAGHGGLKQLSVEQVKIMFRTMKPVMDEKIIWFVFYGKDPVAIFVNLPDLNQWFKYLNGQFGIIQKLYFLWLKKFRENRKFTGLVFGIIPEWQGKGVDAYMVGEAGKIIQSSAVPYTSYEMQWIGDFNPKMINIAKGLGDVYVSRKLITYRYLFDRTTPFERHPHLN
jgi:hypothetical protein